jgi:hypothetical protein
MIVSSDSLAADKDEAYTVDYRTQFSLAYHSYAQLSTHTHYRHPHPNEEEII